MDKLDSIKSLAQKLIHDPKNEDLMASLVGEITNSTYQNYHEINQCKFVLKANELDNENGDKKPFLIISILAQELLKQGADSILTAIELLELSLKLNTPDSNRLRGSICSSLAFAYFSSGQLDKALKFMQDDLTIERELGDINGQCRVLRNLGCVHFKMGSFHESIKDHRKLIDLAMREKLFKEVCYSLSALGFIHSELNNLNDALTSHGRSLELMRELGEPAYNQFQELLSIGHIYAQLNDFTASLAKYDEADKMLMAQHRQDKLSSLLSNLSKQEVFLGHITILFNRAHIALKTNNYHEARRYYEEIRASLSHLDMRKSFIDEITRNKLIFRAYLGLAQTSRLDKNHDEARVWCEKQLDIADDLVSKSQALTNLAMSYQHSKDFDRAHELFMQNHELLIGAGANQARQKLYQHLMAHSYSYLASNYHLMGTRESFLEARVNYEKALVYFGDEMDGAGLERASVETNLATLVQAEMNLNAQQSASTETNHAPTKSTNPNMQSNCPSTTTNSAKTSKTNSISNSFNDINNNNQHNSNGQVNDNRSKQRSSTSS